MKNCGFASVVLIVFLTCSPAMSAGVGSGTYNWTGFYAGLNVGGAINDSKYTLSPTGNFLTPDFSADNPLRTDSGDFNSGAFTGGGQIGYNYQYGCFVFGVETDFNYNGVDESQYVNRALPVPPFFGGQFVHTVTQNFDYFGTFRGRLGYTPVDRFMIYGTGGLAYGDVSSHTDALFTAGGDRYAGSSSGMQAGWAAGAGGEYALTRCLSVKVEYLFIDLGSKTYTYGNQTPNLPFSTVGYTYSTQLDTAEHVIRLGLNYKFF
jgi:outer membrane immunogenic protein